MLKKIFFILLVFLNITVYASQTIQIDDKYNLLGKSSISFKSKKELQDKMQILLDTMLKKGYATSTITFKDNKIKIIPGRVDKVIIKDPSTPLPTLKKHLFGMKLENKILNVADIYKIVQNYNKSHTNKVKVDIEDSSKKHYSNIVVTNDYSFKITPKIKIEFSKNLKTQVNRKVTELGFDAEQILGLNDKVSFTLSPRKYSKYYKINYILPIKNLTLSFKYENTKDSDGKYYKGKFKKLGLNTDYKLYEDKDLNIYLLNSINKEVKRQYIKDTLIVKDIYKDISVGLNVVKYFFNKNNVYTFQFVPNIKFVKKSYKLFDTDTLRCQMSENNLNFYSKYYTLNSFLGYSRSQDGEEIYDNDCKMSSSVFDFDDAPLAYNSSHVFYVNNTLKLPFKLKNSSIYPFTEVALGKDVKEDENLLGASLGIGFDAKYANFGAKYSRFKKDNFFSLKLNLQY